MKSKWYGARAAATAAMQKDLDVLDGPGSGKGLKTLADDFSLAVESDEVLECLSEDNVGVKYEKGLG